MSRGVPPGISPMLPPRELMGTKRGWALALRRGRRDWKRLIVPTTFTYGSALEFGIVIHGTASVPRNVLGTREWAPHVSCRCSWILLDCIRPRKRFISITTSARTKPRIKIQHRKNAPAFAITVSTRPCFSPSFFASAVVSSLSPAMYLTISTLPGYLSATSLSLEEPEPNGSRAPA
jgi:hypothetical protein